MVKDFFDVYVGMVSGKEEVFKNDQFGQMKILNGENMFDNYICIRNFPTNNNDLNNYLLSNKDQLINRKIRKFNENNWFEWGALRNISSIENNLNKDCIYMYNLTRKENVAFIDKVTYFGGGLIILIPKENHYNVEKLKSFFNSNEFKKNFMFSGRFKIGHRQISNFYINTEFIL
jgi:adenine-specific DNA-methyltransferase